MKVGVVVYSKTGHTEMVAQKAMELLKEKGHDVEYQKIEIVGELEGNATDVDFASFPDLAPYGAIIFGTYVEAFSLSRVMTFYLNKIDKISGKKAVCLVTQHLMHKWMGGTRALKQMSNLLKEKGAQVIGDEDVNWKKEEGREDRILLSAKKISELL